MGFIVEINDRVEVELRRESFRLYAEASGDPVEYLYADAGAIEAALREVLDSVHYKDWENAR